MINIPTYSVEIGNLVYDKYERVFNTVTEIIEVYVKERSKDVLDLEKEVHKIAYKEYVEDECKEGFSYFATKAINFVKNITIGGPRERVLNRIDTHNKMYGNDRYIRSIKLIYKNNVYKIFSWYDKVQIKQNIDDIPVY